MSRICQSGFALALSVILVACSTTTRTASAPDTSGSDGRSFKNILVIGVANDYDGRTRFERDLVSELKASGPNATAYYSAVGGNKPIDRQTIEELAKSESFDAVLITKVLNRDTKSTVKTGSSATKATRMDGRAVDLFRYEYQELNEPMRLDVGLSVTLSSELFAISDGQKVWAIEARISDKDMISEIVDEAVATIIRRLRRDGLIG